ncbi:Cysteine synthase [Aliiroseovarius crassostreae]|nr:pyridoxal-phosphate dependent enzyme [Aliiroseovarius crassostreae]SFU29001.1 Cysteine synthase [Aliiroseovarius crassostreae]
MWPKTPVRQFENIIVKMEALQPGGSHKARAARHILQEALTSGQLTPGGPKRILEKSGGNLGVSLAFEAARYDIGVDLVIGLSFSPVKRLLCQRYGARLVGEDALRLGKSPKEVIAQMRAEEPDKWVFTDQFANRANLKAHLEETGPDFSAQIARVLAPGQRLILVKGAGTGASFTGIATSLRANFSTLSTHLVMPEGCDLATDRFVDHPLEGFAVGVVPPFLDLSLVEQTQTISPSEAHFGQSEMAKDIGFFPGMTSGANYAAAKRIARANPDALVATLAYDSGESYLASALLASTEAKNQGERQIA